MGSFVFKWDHQATEVFVTGTFDDWGKTVKLEKKDSTFQKRVDLPKAEKIYYKFVVDGTWTTDHTAPQETDEHSNVNNVLLAKDIEMKPPPIGTAVVSGVTPQSTTAQLAGNVPKETKPDTESSEPETPFHDAQEFRADPLPATAGIGNPISLKPGEKVPDPSTFTNNTINSTVTTDQASYEKGPAVPSQGESAATQGGLFGIPPVTKNIIPESSLPMGGSSNTGDVGPTIQSAAPESTTAALAGQVPKEPRGVPAVVSSSQKEAGVGPEASANAEAVKEKSAVEKELEKKVPEEPATSGNTGTAIAPTVPDTVQKSIVDSNQSPEAATSTAKVGEKSQVENELLKKTEATEQSGKPAPTTSAALSETAPAATGEQITPPRNKEDSRDISPLSHPTVTSGVGSSSTPTQSTPTKGSPAANSSAGTDKKSKRSSGFFHKLKSKFEHRDKKDG